MASLILHRLSTVLDPDNQSYRMTLEVTSTDGITNYVFVNKRLKDYRTNKSEDVFAAVATPAQIEDFGKDAPLEGSCYFLTTKIDIISRNAEYLEDVFNDIADQITKLVCDLEALNSLNDDGYYNISCGNITLEPPLPRPPVITTTSLPAGVQNTVYSQTLTATNNPTSWAISSGSLPNGLTLNTTTGVISGTPTTVQTNSFSVTATNSGGTSIAQTLNIVIAAPAPTGPVITSASSAYGYAGLFFSYTIVASGATSFSASNLPAGLSVNTTTGVISGTVTTVGIYAVTITATDVGGSTDKALTIHINPND